MATKTITPSAGAKRAAQTIWNLMYPHGANRVEASKYAEIIDYETGAAGMAEAIYKLLDYHKRNGAINFQYDKWLDYVHLLRKALDNYENGKEE